LENQTNNEADLTGLILEIYQVSGTQLLFKAINNSGDSQAAIDSIYFEDGDNLFTTITFSAADSSGTVAYTSPASPANPPGFSFTVDTGFDATSNANRVHDGELAGFLANLTTETADATQIDYSGFRVAYHMQSLGAGENDEGSDTYLGTGPENIPIPEPTAATLGLAGALLLLRRRRI
jgi:hypothetical protein